MPEFTVVQLALLASVFAAGIGIGWLLRSDRSAREKIAVNAGWQEQLELAHAENERLGERIRELEGQLAETEAALSEQERKAERLGRQIGYCRARLRPLVERYHAREREVEELRTGLTEATGRLVYLEELAAAREPSLRE
jgi:chromosome segregation ATPase